MPPDTTNGWEPDPRKMGNWRSMFEQDRGGKPAGASPPHGEPPHKQPLDDDDGAMLDPSIYRPWILQRGGHPAMLLHLRRYEARSGLWMGWQLAYHTLIAAEYVGERMLSLDFGSRQFMIEGHGLDELARHLQRGSVLALQEYAASIWPAGQAGPAVTAIKRLGQENTSQC